jgi:L-rhamnose mutarotase
MGDCNVLVRLYYASTAAEGVDMNEFRRILATAQANNVQNDLTGMLVFNSKIFLQALEGSRVAVNTLYSRLTTDPRHKNLMLLKYEAVKQRDFAEWSMAFAAANAANRALFLKHSTHSVFNPYHMDAESVEALMKELASTSIQMQESAAGVSGAAESASGGVVDPAAKASFFARFGRK